MIVFSSAHARLRAAPHAHVTAPRPRWAVRPLAACEPSPLLVTGARRRRAGLSVRWRPANRLACSATLRRRRSQALPSRMHGREHQHRASNDLRQRRSLEWQCTRPAVQPGHEGVTYMRQPPKALAPWAPSRRTPGHVTRRSRCREYSAASVPRRFAGLVWLVGLSRVHRCGA